MANNILKMFMRPKLPLTTNLVAYYALNSGYLDSTGLSGTIVPFTTPPTFATGIIGNGLSFTGTNQRADTPINNNFSFTNNTNDLPFSISVWVTFTGFVSGAGRILSKRGLSGAVDEYHLVASSTQLAFSKASQGNFTNTKTTIINTGWTLNTFYHICVTSDGVSEKIYINGVMLSGATVTTGPYTCMTIQAVPVQIGKYAPLVNTEHLGKIDEYGVWKNRELTQADVTKLYNGGLGFTYPFYSQYSAQLQLVINVAVTNGFTLPNNNTLSQLNTFILGLVSQGIFQKLDYLRIGAYNDTSLTNFSRINIALPSSPLITYIAGTAPTAPLYEAQGVKLGATATNQNTHINTGINLSTTTNFKQNSGARIFVIYSTAGTNGTNYVIDGGINVNSNNTLLGNSNISQSINGGGGLTVAFNMFGTGLRGMIRNSSATTGVTMIVGNVATPVTNATTSVAPFNETLNHGEGQQNVINSCLGFSMGMIGAYLTPTEVEYIRTTYNTYLTALGLPAIA